MTLAQLLAFLGPLAVTLEPVLLNLESTTVMPELNALIANVSSPDLKLLLTSLAGAIDAFAKAEIAKL